MSKVKTTAWALKFGHPTAFRRTVTKNAKTPDEQKYQLVFEPNEPKDLDEAEVAACQDLIDGGLLEPWHLDPKGRRARPNQVARAIEASRVEELELDNAALAEQVAMLIQQVTDLGGTPCVEVVDEEPTTDEAKPNRRKKKNAEPVE